MLDYRKIKKCGGLEHMQKAFYSILSIRNIF